jgi:hypothetical protein
MPSDLYFQNLPSAIQYTFSRRVTLPAAAHKIHVPPGSWIRPLTLRYQYDTRPLLPSPKHVPIVGSMSVRAGLVIEAGHRTQTNVPWFADPKDVYEPPDHLYDIGMTGQVLNIALPKPTVVNHAMMYEIGFLVESAKIDCVSAEQMKSEMRMRRSGKVDPLTSKFDDEFMRTLNGLVAGGLLNKTDKWWDDLIKNMPLPIDYTKNKIVP